MLTIHRVELLPFAIPLATPLATARGAIARRRGVVVRLHADGGLVGVGEAAPHPAAPPEALGAMRAALADAARWLVGAEATRLAALLAEAARLGPAAAAGIDMALHDLAGRAAGTPVCALLGGPARAAVPVSALVADAAAGAAAAAAGFTHAKVKVTRDLAASVAHVAAVRAAAPGLVLRADANGCWTVAEATTATARLAPLEWLEQPVAARDVAGLAEVRRFGAVPIAADEAVTGPDAVARLTGAADVVILKLVQVGGLACARATAAAAHEAGIAIAVTTAIDTAIATAAALHLAAALPGPLRACGLATAGLLAGDLVRVPLLEGPAMRPPAGPGLGVELDPEALARFRDEDGA